MFRVAPSGVCDGLGAVRGAGRAEGVHALRYGGRRVSLDHACSMQCGSVRRCAEVVRAFTLVSKRRVAAGEEVLFNYGRGYAFL